MTIFAVTYRYSDKPDELTEVRPAHRDYLLTLLGDGGLVASGRTEGGSTPSALLIFEAESPGVIEAALDVDPFWLAGLIEHREILEWTVSMGSLGLDGEH
jgi:uncharacterized protein YciI